MVTSNGTAETKQKALLEVGRAVFDSVLKKLPGHISKALEPHRAEFASQLKTFRDEIMAGVSAMMRKELDAHSMAMSVAYQKQLQESSSKSLDDGLAMLRELLTNMPPSQVHLPAEAIRVEVDQKPSHVHLPADAISLRVDQLNLPKDAIRVEVNQPTTPVHLTVPDGAFQVYLDQGEQRLVVPDGAFQINVPEQSAPVVNVSTPRRKTKTERSIIYNQGTGRPEKLIDETTEMED